MIGVKYCGSLLDPSGYGSANRAFVTSLYVAGINIATEIVSQTLATTTYGWEGELVKHLEGREINHKIKIIHLTPDLYPKYMEDGKYHIGHLFWETDKLPIEWVQPCNMMNEIWTGTEGQREIIKNSGVKVPIYIFPEPLDVTNNDRNITPWVIPGSHGLIFYSIFQWIERKDPFSLLTTYWKTFEGRDDITLVLKTYRSAYTESDFNRIKEDIERWKKGLKQSHYPRVLLIKELWTSDKIIKLHKMGGVFISTSHGEGWCRPAVEASLAGNPVVSIDRTGFADFYPKDIFYPVNCATASVIPQSSIAWYQKEQNWYNIDVKHLSETMREIYNNVDEAKERGKKSKAFVEDNLNYWTVGQNMKGRLEEILRFI